VAEREARLNPEQPLIHPTKVSADDVERQEAVVTRTRRALAEAMAKLQG